MRLIIPEYVEKRLRLYANLCKTEIGGIGHIQRGRNEEFYLEKIVLLPRRVGYAFVDAAPEAYVQYITNLPEEEIKSIRFFWHSHPGGVTPSLQDEESIQNLAAAKGWIFWMILNRNGKYQASLEITANNNDTFRFPIETEIKSLEEEVKEEIAGKMVSREGGELSWQIKGSSKSLMPKETSLGKPSMKRNRCLPSSPNSQSREDLSGYLRRFLKKIQRWLW